MIEVQGITRQAFMVRGAVAAGTVYGLGAVSPFVREALAQEGGGDVEVLNFALTLEYLEAAFYTQALKDTKGLKGEAKEIATTLRDNETEHVDALTAAIKDAGGTPVQAPGVDFGQAFASQSSFLKLAQTFEDLGVSAYNGAARTSPPARSTRPSRRTRSSRPPSRSSRPDPAPESPPGLRRRTREPRARGLRRR